MCKFHRRLHCSILHSLSTSQPSTLSTKASPSHILNLHNAIASAAVSTRFTVCSFDRRRNAWLAFASPFARSSPSLLVVLISDVRRAPRNCRSMSSSFVRDLWSVARCGGEGNMVTPLYRGTRALGKKVEKGVSRGWSTPCSNMPSGTLT